MSRTVRWVAVLCVLGAAFPAAAKCRGVRIGPYLYGYTKHRNVPCPQVIVSGQVLAPQVLLPAPPVVYGAPIVAAPVPPPISAYTPPPVVVAPAPLSSAPQIVYAPPPMVQAPVVLVPPPSVVTPKPPKPERPRPGILAVKYMPGVSSNVRLSGGDPALDTPTFAHSPGLEVRLTRWFSLRSDLEFRNDSRTWDMLGVKLSLFPSSFIKPYASLSFSGSERYDNPGQFSFGFAAAAGLDLFIGRHFFLEAEARYRMTPGSCCSEVPAVTGVIGGGVAFF